MPRKRIGEGAGVTPLDESKADKFRRLGNRRLSAAVKALRNLARLGNRRAYDYGADQANVLFETIERAMARLKRAFSEEPPDRDGETRYF